MKFIITNILLIISTLMVSYFLSAKYVNLDFNDFVLETKKVRYTQGAVVVFSKINPEKNDNCSKYDAKILDYTKSIVGKAYCREFRDRIKIFADTSEFPQGRYYLLTKENDKEKISKKNFVVEIISDYEITGEKR